MTYEQQHKFKDQSNLTNHLLGICYEGQLTYQPCQRHYKWLDLYSLSLCLHYIDFSALVLMTIDHYYIGFINNMSTIISCINFILIIIILDLCINFSDLTLMSLPHIHIESDLALKWNINSPHHYISFMHKFQSLILIVIRLVSLFDFSE